MSAAKQPVRRPRRRILHSVAEIYRHCQLKGVKFTYIHAAELESDGDPGSGRLEGSSAMSDDNRTMFIKVESFVSSQTNEYVVAVMAAYESEKPFKVPDEVVGDFINSSAIITLTPFLREAVISLATRLDDKAAPLIPLMGLGVGALLEPVSD